MISDYSQWIQILSRAGSHARGPAAWEPPPLEILHLLILEVFNLSAPDTFASLPTLDLIRKLWPTLTDLRGDISGHQPLTDCRKAVRLLGFEAIYSVRDEGA